jgi:hypothetical protein
MNKKLFIRLTVFFLCVLCTQFTGAYAQDDSTAKKETVEPLPVQVDSVKPKVIKQKPKEAVAPVKMDSTKSVSTVDSTALSVKKDSLPVLTAYGSAILPFINNHPYYNTQENVIVMPSQPNNIAGKDELFYIMCGVLFFLGILKVGFPKYFQDLFNVFWRSAFRQKQIRDQLQQAGMTTLLFNVFFVFSLALFTFLVVEYLKGAIANPWILFSICFFSIAFVYTFKYFILKLSGWMFGQEEALDTYTFIVFMVNKILSILIIPFTLILAFSDKPFQQIAFTVSILLIIFLLIYRFIVAYIGMRNELKISGLHLLLYVFGFEIVPVLLIYRMLVDLFERSS